MIFLGRTTAALLAAALAMTEARASDPTGTWHTKGQQAQVRIAKCAENICGTIVALKDPIDPATGKPQADIENDDIRHIGLGFFEARRAGRRVVHHEFALQVELLLQRFAQRRVVVDQKHTFGGRHEGAFFCGQSNHLRGRGPRL